MVRLAFLIGLTGLNLAAWLEAQESQAPSKSAAANWAEDFLAKDLLSAKERVTLEDIKIALSDPAQRDTVLARHWGRLEGVSDNEKKDFLVELMKDKVLGVQSQAARELGQMRKLEEVVATMLVEFLQSDDAALREAALVAMTHIDFGENAKPDGYWKLLIESLESENKAVRDAAILQLEAAGDPAVPSLIESLHDPRPNIRLQAAEILSRIVGSKSRILSKTSRETPSTVTSGPDLLPSNIAPSPPKGAAIRKGHQPRKVDPKKPELVRIYFGTNRERDHRVRTTWQSIVLFAAIGLAALWGFVRLWRSPSKNVHFNSCSTVLLTIALCFTMVWSFFTFREQLLDYGKIGTGPKFGPRRDAPENVHYGFCDVSIPPTHIVGELEEPFLGPENEEEHVVLRRTEEMEENAFFEKVKSEIAKLEPSNRNCFIFIHGFNVTFEKAAKRTAQIHHDLKFKGMPIFFSWPSRASIHQYFSDRNEIEFSRYVIKQFLVDVAERVDADRIHVIAHSMGADATCRAIAELGERGKIFDQIILAAPDIDREVFRVQLLPRLAKTANRTTLYCSGSDLALHLSYTFNDSPRAGDSSRGIFVSKELDTVDASGIDTDLLGHSYYGDCLPILNDVRLLMDQNLPPDQRTLKPWPFQEMFKYWTFY